MLTVCSVPVVFSSTQVSLLDPDQSLTAKCFHVSWLFIICCQPIIDMGNDFRTRSLCPCHANSSTLSMNIKSWSDRNIYIYISSYCTHGHYTHSGFGSLINGVTIKKKKKKKKRGQRDSPSACPVYHFGHISPEKTPKSELCWHWIHLIPRVRGAYFGTPVSWSSLSTPRSSCFLLLSLCSVFLPNLTAWLKLAHYGLVYKAPWVQRLHVSHIGLA